MVAEQDNWVSFDEAMEILGVSRRTLHKYVQDGKLPGFKSPIGGRTVFKREDLEAFKKPQPIKKPGRQDRLAM